MNLENTFIDLNGNRTYDESVKKAHDNENAFILVEETERYMYIKKKNDAPHANYQIISKRNKPELKINICKDETYTIYNIEDRISYAAHNINFIYYSSCPYKTTNHKCSTSYFIHYPPLLKCYNQQIAPQYQQYINQFSSVIRLSDPKDIIQIIINTNANSPSRANHEQANNLLCLAQYYINNQNYPLTLYYLNKAIYYSCSPKIQAAAYKKIKENFDILTPQAQQNYTNNYKDFYKIFNNQESISILNTFIHRKHTDWIKCYALFCKASRLLKHKETSEEGLALLESIPTSVKLPNWLKSKISNKMGFRYHSLGQIEKASKCFWDTTNITNAHPASRLQSLARLSYICLIYPDQIEQTQNAKKYAEETLYNEALKNFCPYSTDLAHFVLGALHYNKNEYQIAHKHFKDIADHYVEAVKTNKLPFYFNDDLLSSTFISLAKIYSYEKIPIMDEKERVEIISQSIKNTNKSGFDAGGIYGTRNINIALKQANDKKALEYAEKAKNLQNIDDKTKEKIEKLIEEMRSEQEKMNSACPPPKTSKKGNSCRIGKIVIKIPTMSDPLNKIMSYYRFLHCDDWESLC